MKLNAENNNTNSRSAARTPPRGPDLGPLPATEGRMTTAVHREADTSSQTARRPMRAAWHAATTSPPEERSDRHDGTGYTRITGPARRRPPIAPPAQRLLSVPSTSRRLAATSRSHHRLSHRPTEQSPQTQPECPEPTSDTRLSPQGVKVRSTGGGVLPHRRRDPTTRAPATAAPPRRTIAIPMPRSRVCSTVVSTRLAAGPDTHLILSASSTSREPSSRHSERSHSPQ